MRAIFTLSVAAMLTGCTGFGDLPFGNSTTTHLERANFRVVKANARGEDSGFYLLGVLPLREPSITDAVDALQSGIRTEGRAVSLVNVTQERRNGYFVLFSISKLIVRADVIEFLPESINSQP